MNSNQKIIDYCLTLPGVYLDYPFDDVTPALRHSANKKIFALLLEHAGQPMLNLKCEPMQADFWRSVHSAVIPGYHMNKNHWNSVLLYGLVPDNDIMQMIFDSYTLTKPKAKKTSGGKHNV